jgi:hypothetical protein
VSPLELDATDDVTAVERQRVQSIRAERLLEMRADQVLARASGETDEELGEVVQALYGHRPDPEQGEIVRRALARASARRSERNGGEGEGTNHPGRGNGEPAQWQWRRPENPRTARGLNRPLSLRTGEEELVTTTQTSGGAMESNITPPIPPAAAPVGLMSDDLRGYVEECLSRNGSATAEAVLRACESRFNTHYALTSFTTKVWRPARVRLGIRKRPSRRSGAPARGNGEGGRAAAAVPSRTLPTPRQQSLAAEEGATGAASARERALLTTCISSHQGQVRASIREMEDGSRAFEIVISTAEPEIYRTVLDASAGALTP